MRRKLEGRRGRPDGRNHSQADIQLLEYLARVSLKYEVDSDNLFDSLLKVYQHQESKCEKLSIECRLRKRDYAIFLITRDQKVVGQFRISERLLNEKTNPLEEYICRLPAMKTSTREARSRNYKIDIIAQVLEVSEPIQITTRSGFYAYLANALIADETGTINLSLLGSQIKEVALNDVIQIENAHVAWFRGRRQLRVGKHGKISVVKSTENKIKIQ